MPLLSLPDELLNKIAKHTVAAHHFDAQFRGELEHRPFPVGRVFCVNGGVQELSLGNSRLRRICIPLVFFSVAVSFCEPVTPPHIKPPKYVRLEENLDHLRRLLESRPHIGQHIRSLMLHASKNEHHRLAYETHAGPDPDQMVPILALLPRVVELPVFSVLSEELIYAVDAHPYVSNLRSHQILRNDTGLYCKLSPEPDQLPGPLRKITLCAIDLTANHNAVQWPIIEKYLKLGMNVDQIKICDTPEHMRRLDSLPFGRITSLSIELDTKNDESVGESPGDWLSSFIGRVSGVSSISLSGFDVPSRCLSISADLCTALQRSELLDIVSIPACRLNAANPKDPSADVSGVRSKHWETEYVYLRFRLHPVSWELLGAFVGNLSSLSELHIDFQSDRRLEPVPITMAESIAEHLTSLQALRFLRLDNLKFEDPVQEVIDWDAPRSDRTPVATNLAKALCHRIPSLERIEMSFYRLAMIGPNRGALVTRFQFHARRQLFAEGGGWDIRECVE